MRLSWIAVSPVSHFAHSQALPGYTYRLRSEEKGGPVWASLTRGEVKRGDFYAGPFTTVADAMAAADTFEAAQVQVVRYITSLTLDPYGISSRDMADGARLLGCFYVNGEVQLHFDYDNNAPPVVRNFVVVHVGGAVPLGGVHVGTITALEAYGEVRHVYEVPG